MPIVIRVRVVNDTLTDAQKRAPGFDAIVGELIGNDIQSGAKARAAVDTGFMRDNITLETLGNGFRAVAEAPYSGYVEYGTRKMAAQPFMIPATEAADVDGACQEALKRIGL